MQRLVEVVNAVVAQLAAGKGAQRLPVPAPAEGVDRQLDLEDAAEHAGCDDLAHLEVAGFVAAILEHGEERAGAAGGGEHAVGVGQVLRHRLLADDRLAGLQRRDGVDRVQVARRGHDHQLDLPICQELAVTGVGPAAERLLRLGPARLDQVGHGDDPVVLRHLLQAQGMDAPAAAAQADDAHANR